MKRRHMVMGFALVALGCVMGMVIAGGGSGGGATPSTPSALAQTTGIPIEIDGGPGLEIVNSLSDAFVRVAQAVTPAVVTIHSTQSVKAAQAHPQIPGMPRDFFRRRRGDQGRDPERRGMGSGVLISQDGYILTSNHVVEGAEDLEITVGDDTEYTAEIVGTDPKTDIAVVKIDAEDQPFIGFGNSDEVKVGQWVLAIGSPFSDNLQHSVSHGIVSAKGRQIGLIAGTSNYGGFEDFIQTDAAINPGNSGGPLVDLNGRLVGINTAISSNTGSNTGVGFAIPANLAKSIMQQIIADGRVVRGWLGVGIGNVTQTTAEALGLASNHGTFVESVGEDGPADKGGVEPKDIIVEVDGEPIKDANELRFRIAGTAPGTEIEMIVVRSGRRRTLEITLGELPERFRSQSSTTASSGEALGMTLVNLTSELSSEFGHSDKTGVVVTSVERGSAAADQRIMRGDLISEIARQKVRTVDEATLLLTSARPGKAILLLIHRQDRTFFVGVRVPQK